MAQVSSTIPKNPKQKQSQDYLFLRRKAIGYIERMGSKWWTDYNSHDPGITILEALCFAISDLGYRCGWEMRDLLAGPDPKPGDAKLQAFFTAEEILTVNPLTINDYRRLLIGLDRVDNAWPIPKMEGCNSSFYADCEHERLNHTAPAGDPQALPIPPLGTWDVLLELENDAELGDLNDRKIRHAFTLNPDKSPSSVTAELRFPEWDVPIWGLTDDYVDKDGSLKREISDVKITASPHANFSTGQNDDVLWKQWQRIFYLTFDISFAGGGTKRLEGLPFRLFGDSSARRAFSKQLLEAWDFKPVITLFLKKMATAERALHSAAGEFLNHRNLCEDLCCCRLVGIEDVAVCADIEVKGDADIEQVMAEVLFRLERLINPVIRLYSLQELMDEGMAIEEIFKGPVMDGGFIKEEELERTSLETPLRIRTSDLVNDLVEIEGVVAVRNLLLTRYDQSGTPVSGVSDIEQGAAAGKISAEWTLEISANCRSRFYASNSRFMFYKNGLPFSARADEVQDTLNQLRGADGQMKIREHAVAEESLLPVPKGRYRNPGRYSSIRQLFPRTYGIGPEGLPSNAPAERKVQAMQLKAYLMFFEQMLANHFAQLAHVGDLFSLDAGKCRTYFYRDFLTEGPVPDAAELLEAGLSAELPSLVEPDSVAIERKNRFLDHLMARFGEQFSDHALLFTDASSAKGKNVLAEKLIMSKISIIENYPWTSRERARSFNHTLPYDDSFERQATLRRRIALLLGLGEELEKEIMIVEHLLLRPKFPGDALMETFLDKSRKDCNLTDPYSFRLTVVMPGWAEPFKDNVELRRFAERTILGEIPSHLLARICWTSNDDPGADAETQFAPKLAELLLNKGLNRTNTRLSERSALSGSKKIIAKALPAVSDWIRNTGKNLPEARLRTGIHSLLTGILPDATLVSTYDVVGNFDKFSGELRDLFTDHFTKVAAGGRWLKHLRFGEAWRQWLEENARFDWCGKDHVAGTIDRRLSSVKGIAAADISEMKAVFASAFAENMKRNALEGITFGNETARREEVSRIVKIAHAVDNRIEPVGDIFVDTYAGYVEVSLKLWRALILLAELHNIYAPATLHDCDDGSDENPVRLGSTALGQ